MTGLPPISSEGVLSGLLAVAVGWVLSRLARAAVSRVLVWRHRSPGSAAVFGRLAGWVVLVLGLGAGLTIIGLIIMCLAATRSTRTASLHKAPRAR